MLEIRDITVDNQKNSIVTDNSVPEVGFALHSDIPDTFLQSAKVTVFDRVFDCGTNQVCIPLDGIGLKPFTVCPIEIYATDNHGNSAVSGSSFQTARLGMPWDARWITDKSYNFGKKTSPVPMTFSRKFSIHKPIKKAYITSTAMGIYELMLNDKKVGEDYFAPGFTSYRKNLQYQFYDVTRQLRHDNTLVAVVAGGWAAGRFTYESKNKITVDRQAFLLELFLEYSDSSTEKIITDENWLVTMQGNYRFACLYDGETYDATVNLNNAQWKPADIIKLKFNPRITVSNGNMVKRHELLKPVSSFHNGDRELIYDFGQNFAGVVSLKIQGRQGQKITVRHAEVLDGERLYTKSLRTAKATAVYICKNGIQTYSPKLTYMGFRYIGITGISPEDVEVSAYALYSDFSQTGSFECSDLRLNKLQNNILWAGKSNFVDIPTDCPQRDERQGWTGDISIFASTACYNFDLSRFIAKWLKDIRLEQGRGGGIPMVVPRHGNTAPVVATACWGDSCILVPWAEYLARGSTRLLRQQYPCMKRFMKAVKFWSSLYGPGDRRYIFKWLFQFGDWCAPEGKITDWLNRGKWMGTAYYANSAYIMSEIATILGETEDSKYYKNLQKNICRAFRNVLTDGHGKLRKEFQTGYVLPLYFEMEAGENRQRMADNLNRLVKDNGYRLSTGFPGTPYILFALADNGHKDTAFRLLLQEDCPSWLYCVKMSGTTFWEQWNTITPEGEIREPSMNHYAYGAVGDFFYRRILGIEATSGGYRNFCVKPVSGGGIGWAKGSVQTPYGMIYVSRYTENDEFIITTEVPVSTECELIMPSGKKIRLTSGTHTHSEKITKEQSL